MIASCINLGEALRWIPLLALIVTLTAFIYQICRSRFTFGVDLLMKLDERFNKEPMISTRRKAAKSILENKNCEDAEDVLDFFETIGLLLKRKAIDGEIVWHTFFHWMQGYLSATQSHVESKRAADFTKWEDFINAYQIVFKIEEQKNTNAQRTLTTEEIQKFLQDESQL